MWAEWKVTRNDNWRVAQRLHYGMLGAWNQYSLHACSVLDTRPDLGQRKRPLVSKMDVASAFLGTALWDRKYTNELSKKPVPLNHYLLPLCKQGEGHWEEGGEGALLDGRLSSNKWHWGAGMTGREQLHVEPHQGQRLGIGTVPSVLWEVKWSCLVLREWAAQRGQGWGGGRIRMGPASWEVWRVWVSL
jgi:hypothetical protein